MSTLSEAFFDTSRASKAARTLANELDKLSKKAKGSGESLDNVQSRASKTSRVLKDLRSSVIGTVAAFLGFRALTGVISATVRTQTAFENLTARLRAATGSIPAASREFSTIRDRVNDLGLDLLENAKGFSNFAAASQDMDLTRRVFQGITAASGALRLSIDDQHGVWRALTQIMSKGKVQAEEIRGQLGERLPGAFRIAAESIGVTQQELSLMLDRGELASERLLPRFAKAMEDAFGEDAQRNAETLGAKMARFNNELFRWKTLIASGFIGQFKDTLEESIDQMQTADSVAHGFGVSLGFVAKAATAGVVSLANFGRNMGAILAAGGRDFNKAGPQSLISALFGIDFTSGVSKADSIIKDLEKSMTRLESLRHRGDKLFLIGNVILADWISALQELQLEGKDFSEVQAELNPITERLVGQFEELGIKVPGIVQGFLDMADAERKAKTSTEDLGDGVGDAAKEIEKLRKEAAKFAEETKTEFGQAIEELTRVEALEGFFDSPETFKAVREFFAGKLRLAVAEAANETAAFVKQQAEDFAEFLEENLGQRIGIDAPESNPFISDLGVDDIDFGPGVKNAELDEQLRKSAQWAALIDSVALSFRGVNREIGRGITMVADLVFSWNELPETTKKWSLALSAASQLLVGILGDAKNFAKEGQAIGGAIGAIAGTALSGGSPAGGQAGAAIGQAIGGIVGSLIKKGSDVGTAWLEQHGDSIATSISRDDGGLGRKMGELAADTMSAILSTVGRAGGVLESIGRIGFNQRDGVIEVWVNGIKGFFENTRDALEFATVQAIKTAGISGLSENFKKALSQGTLEQINAALGVAEQLESFGIPEASRSLRSQLEPIVKLMEEAARVGMDYSNALSEITNVMSRNRDQILGIEKDFETQLRERAEAFNSERQRLEEQALNKLLELQESLGGSIEGEVSDAFENAREKIIRDSAAAGESLRMLAETIIATGTISAAAAEQIRSQMDQIETFLSNLAPAITEEDIQEAIRRRRRRGAKEDRKRDIETFDERMEELKLRLLDSQARAERELAMEREEMVELAERLGRSVSEVNEIFDQLAEKAMELRRQNLHEELDQWILSAEELKQQDFHETIKRWRDEAIATGISLDKVAEAAGKLARSLTADVFAGAHGVLLRALEMAGKSEQAARLRWRLDIMGLQIERAKLAAAIKAAKALDAAAEKAKIGVATLPSSGADGLRKILDPEIRTIPGVHGDTGLKKPSDRTPRLPAEGPERILSQLDDLIRELLEAGPPSGGLGGGQRPVGIAQQEDGRLQSILKEIRNYQRDLEVDSQKSPFTRIKRAQIAEQNFRDTLQKAKGGDLDALAELTGLADTALETRRDVDPRGTAGYKTLFDFIQESLSGARAAFGDTSVAGQTLKASQETNDHLRQIKERHDLSIEELRQIRRDSRSSRIKLSIIAKALNSRRSDLDA